VRAERHVADDGGGRGDKNIFAEPRRLAEKFVELWRKFVHAENLAAAEIESKCRAKNAKVTKEEILIPSPPSRLSRDTVEFSIGRTRDEW
jgi:hypothetical protein